MTIYDVTVPIQEGLPVWPGEEGPTIKRTSDIDSGDKANVSLIRMVTHTGTHVDAPLHFFAKARSVDRIPLSVLCGPCLVIEKIGNGHISAGDIPELPSHITRVLFKTTNSTLWENPTHDFVNEYVCLEPEAAELLVRKGIQLVGMDYMSVEPPTNQENPIHRLLLGNGIVIIENLDLRNISPGEYNLVCLPLKLSGADGAPARVILISDK